MDAKRRAEVVAELRRYGKWSAAVEAADALEVAGKCGLCAGGPDALSTAGIERMPDADFEMRVRTEGTWKAVASGERAETALAIEARRARSEEDRLCKLAETCGFCGREVHAGLKPMCGDCAGKEDPETARLRAEVERLNAYVRKHIADTGTIPASELLRMAEERSREMERLREKCAMLEALGEAAAAVQGSNAQTIAALRTYLARAKEETDALQMEATHQRERADTAEAMHEGAVEVIGAELAAAAKRLEKVEANALAALPKPIREALSRAERALLLHGAESEEDGSPGRQALASVQEARQLLDARGTGGRT